MKFAPHCSGKQQMVTCDTVKDHIAQTCQKTMRCGINTAKATRNMEHSDSPEGTEPKRRAVVIDPKDDKGNLALQIMQHRHDVKCKEDLRKHNTRKDICEENKLKAHALIFGCCNKTMQNRIEEAKSL